MAATLTPSGELTYLSFPLDKSKTEITADGDVIVYGKATDGIVDSDHQIVDPVWAAKAIKEWLNTGANVRVQHNAQRDPAGKGIEVTGDGVGGQWVKALIVEPVAKQLVLKGVLQAYSVGIMNPSIVHDPLAINGRINGGELGEISLVDRPANKNCRFEMVKSAGNGGLTYVGKVSGTDEVITKALGSSVEKVGPKGYEHGWVYVGHGGAEAKDAEHAAASAEHHAGHDAKETEHGATRATHEGTKVSHAALADRAAQNPKSIKDLSDDDLKGVDREFTKRAKSVGKEGQVSSTHKKVKDEIARRKTKSDEDETKKPSDDDDGKDDGEGETGEESKDSEGGGGGGGAPGMPGLPMGGGGGSGAGGSSGGTALSSRVGGLPPGVSVINNHVNEQYTGAVSGLSGKTIDPNVGGGVDRKKISAKDFAGPHGSYPIVTPKDVSDAAGLVGHAGNPAAVKRRIINIAHRKGPDFVAQIPDSWKGAHVDTETDDTIDKGGKQCPACDRYNKKNATECAGAGCDHSFKAASEEVAKTKKPANDDSDSDDDYHNDDGSDGDAGDDGADSGDDGDDDDDDDSDDDDNKSVSASVKKGKMSCPKCSGTMKAKSKFCPECGNRMATADVKKSLVTAGRTEPTPADGVADEHADPVPAHREPDGSAIEAFEADAKIPTDPDVMMKTAHRIASVSAPDDLGVLHDLLCPAFSHKSVRTAYPHTDLHTHVDVTEWQMKALDAAAGAPMEEAAAATKRWQNATIIASVPSELISELRKEAHKSFQDANPGVGSFPTPSSITAGQFKRPYLATGNARPSFQQEGPNTSPVISSTITASQFDRTNLTGGHAEDSPANKSANRAYYTNAQRDNARQAMSAMHDHIAHLFPDVCPMDGEGSSPAQTGPIDATPVGKTASAEKVPVEKAAKPVTKAAVVTETGDVLHGDTAALVKSAVAAATAGLAEELAATKAALKSQRRETKKLAGQVDTLANLANPTINPYKGMAFNPVLKGMDAGRVRTPSELAEFSQLMVQADLQDTVYNSTDPRQREAARQELMKMRGIA